MTKPAPKIVTDRRYAIHAVGEELIHMPPGCAKEGAMRHASEYSREIGRPVEVWLVNADSTLDRQICAVDSTNQMPASGAHCPTCLGAETGRDELRRLIAEKLTARWKQRAADRVEDSPEGHCADLADVVLDLLLGNDPTRQL